MIVNSKYYRILPLMLVCVFLVNIAWSQEVKDVMVVDLSVLRSFDLITADQKAIRINPVDKTLSLFIFLSPECPLCQNYTKVLNELQGKFGKQVNVFGIVPGKAYTTEQVAAFKNKYQTAFQLFIDKKQLLTNYLKATVTPQAILLNNKGTVVYSGSIDDWVQAQGKTKLQPTQAYVQDAIEQLLTGAPVKISKTKVFGCRINDY